jgi:hypothetical protein
MTTYLCQACATQYPPSDEPPAACPICEDPRQYIPHDEGQRWLSFDEFLGSHEADVRDDHGLLGIGCTPSFAIGQRALLSGDIVQVIPDRRYVSFMYSYPNLIPLPVSKVRHIAAAVAPFEFDTIYGAWFDRFIGADGSNIVRRSAERYIRAVTEPGLPS